MIHTDIGYASHDELLLDPKNPRLGRENVAGKGLSQDKILDLMMDWELDELATSFVESNYFPQEALIVVKEGNQKIVVEGNRRLATLKLLAKPPPGNAKWAAFAKEAKQWPNLTKKIPYIVADKRGDVDAFLGFRHVTGIKEWHPAEKAEFIAKLVEQGQTYEEVRRKIGSKAPTVRQHYVAYRLLLQMEGREDIELSKVEQKFSVLYLSLRTQGVRKYLAIDVELPPEKIKQPVPKKHIDNLSNFARWLFGDDKTEPLFRDSRYVDEFGRILENKGAVKYLENTPSPSFEYARRLSGTAEDSAIEFIRLAVANAAEALKTAHLFPKSTDLAQECSTLLKHAMQLNSIFTAEAK